MPNIAIIRAPPVFGSFGSPITPHSQARKPVPFARRREDRVHAIARYGRRDEMTGATMSLVKSGARVHIIDIASLHYEHGGD
jgi:hypothetical protein